MINKEDEKILDEIYFGDGAGAFSAPDKLWRAAKLRIPSLKKDDVVEYMNTKRPGYVLTKTRAYSQFPRKLSARYAYTTKAQFEFQQDTCLFTEGFDFTHVQVIVDAFSNVIYVDTSKLNNAEKATLALKKCMKKALQFDNAKAIYPNAIYTDKVRKVRFSKKRYFIITGD